MGPEGLGGGGDVATTRRVKINISQAELIQIELKAY